MITNKEDVMFGRMRRSADKNAASGSGRSKSLLQVNLDMGPIQIPKSQLSPNNNPDLLCKLELLENGVLFQEYHIKKSIDAVANTLGLFGPSSLLNKPDQSKPSSDNSADNKRQSNSVINDAKIFSASFLLLFFSFLLNLIFL